VGGEGPNRSASKLFKRREGTSDGRFRGEGRGGDMRQLTWVERYGWPTGLGARIWHVDEKRGFLLTPPSTVHGKPGGRKSIFERARENRWRWRVG